MAESKLRGVIAAVATPVNEDGSPDIARATKLARYLIDKRLRRPQRARHHRRGDIVFVG